MRKRKGMNPHQKAVYKVGEQEVSREQVTELLEMACSTEVEERLTAAQYLCPCHVKGRIPAVWEAIFRMMEDDDRRVRYAAWHTWEDGGVPNDPETLTTLERLYQQETDTKVKKFAWVIIGKAVTARREEEMARLNLSTRPALRQRGKCDFCGERDVFVVLEPSTLIPTGSLPRPALVCEACR